MIDISCLGMIGGLLIVRPVVRDKFVITNFSSGVEDGFMHMGM